MIIINKKRISIIITCLLLGLFAFSFQIADNKQEVNEITMSTTAIPVSGKTVIIDAGHGKPDEGAESSNGVTEAEINLKIAQKVQNLLEQSGCTVVLTRSDENSIYDLDKNTLKEKKVSDIRNRVKLANDSSADIFVSIHLNKIPQQQYYGWQCFYNKSNKESIALAKKLQKNLNETIQIENKRVAMNLEKVYIMKHVEIPISIVECGFLSNLDEEKKLLEDGYQSQLAWGIFNGINDYFLRRIRVMFNFKKILVVEDG